MPHGMCYLWQPGLLWTHVLSDFFTGSAYFAISLMLGYLVYRSAVEHVDEAGAFKGLPFWWMFLAFGLFIVACGGTHFLAVWNVWNADYWLSAGVKALTAAASVATAIALPPLIPRSLHLLRTARESEIRKGQLEVAHEELRATHARIQELDHLKTEFFANVSHELRTPLALILGPTEERLADPDLRSDQRQFLEMVRRNAQILHRHVADLLDVTRFDAGMMRVQRRRLDLTELLRRTTSLFEAAAVHRGVELVFESSGKLEAFVDPDAIERVVMNLVSNALKFTPSGGLIRVRLEARGDTVRFEVRDSGPGIPEHLRDQVFERFRQLEGSAARAFGGTGLGLTIVRDLVELHEGSISVGEAPGGGAAFVVVLPLRVPEEGVFDTVVDDAASALSPTDRPAPPLVELLTGPEVPAGAALDETRRRPATSAAVRAPLVLFVEDNVDMGGFLLGAMPEGIQGVWARDAREGLERAEDLKPDVIVSDVMMPDMTGQQLLRTVRAHRELSQIPFIVLTARDDLELKVALLEEGAQDYITKPFHPREVRARVANWVAVARARGVLREELAGTAEEDLEVLAREVASSRQRMQEAFEIAERAREREAEASHAKSSFLATMSHELRTPLNAITGYTELLTQGITGPVTDRQRAHLERIAASASHMLTMIEDVLDFAAAEAQKLSMVLEPVEISAVLRELEAIVGGRAYEMGISMAVEREPHVETVQADRRRLRQILLNLLDNALKYIARGEVRLRVASEGELVLFRVEDTGPGIDPEHHERIFDAFWQVDQAATRPAGGMGLGLSISRRLAREMGGDLTVASREGGGSVFTLALPWHPELRDRGTEAVPSTD